VSGIEERVNYMGKRMRLLVAYDGSGCADAALADLKRAGLPREVEALVFTVGDVFLPPVSSYEVVARALASRRVTSAIAQSQAQSASALEEARAVADGGCGLLRSAFPHWEVRAEVVAGTPSRAIIEMAERWDADLVVVGSHGRSALGRLLLGSVSKKVATEARNSVRVTRCLEGKVIVDAPIRLLVGFDGSPSARAAVRAVARRAWPAGSTARVVAVAEFPPATPIGGLMPAAASSDSCSGAFPRRSSTTPPARSRSRAGHRRLRVAGRRRRVNVVLRRVVPPPTRLALTWRAADVKNLIFIDFAVELAREFLVERLELLVLLERLGLQAEFEADDAEVISGDRAARLQERGPLVGRCRLLHPAQFVEREPEVLVDASFRPEFDGPGECVGRRGDRLLR
jgi:nucleotide-binding universal stress UspA family protein